MCSRPTVGRANCDHLSGPKSRAKSKPILRISSVAIRNQNRTVETQGDTLWVYMPVGTLEAEWVNVGRGQQEPGCGGVVRQ
ncbi:hypothetical protein PAXRUDRAFT_832529 [Paxillus rubicundulus Ve08.2h10]|uniref:Uncharacterized protein n=1 Tax=Paxillus rubicundulus Ve08.2h10 TaxID=930991 RepID=A0A0D0DJX6_9AGAM|nr:hypothetical protein PAXRUDRAFT_832529 [Paxillus rubicundulus Ve08.2h10]